MPDESFRFILEPVEKPNEKTDGACTSPPVRISTFRHADSMLIAVIQTDDEGNLDPQPVT